MSTDYIPFTVTDLDLTEEMQNELLENMEKYKDLYGLFLEHQNEYRYNENTGEDIVINKKFIS